jgi:hypothetical protein
MPNATTTAAAVQFTIGNSYSRAVSAAPQSIPTNVDAKGSSSMTGEESKKIRVRSQINPQRFQIHKGYFISHNL